MKYKENCDVIIATNKSQNSPIGYTLTVTFKEGKDKICFPSGRIELKPREKKLVFRESDKGFKIGSLGGKRIGFRVTNKSLCPFIIPYVGNFNLLHDDLRNYYYIDLENTGAKVKKYTVEKQQEDTEQLEKYIVPEQSEWYVSTKAKQDLIKANSDLEFQKSYIEELEKENKLLKEEIIDMRGKITSLEKDLPKSVKEELKNSCINAMREYLDAEEFREAKTISELISIVFEGKKITH